MYWERQYIKPNYIFFDFILVSSKETIVWRYDNNIFIYLAKLCYALLISRTPFSMLFYPANQWNIGHLELPSFIGLAITEHVLLWLSIIAISPLCPCCSGICIAVIMCMQRAASSIIWILNFVVNCHNRSDYYLCRIECVYPCCVLLPTTELILRKGTSVLFIESLWRAACWFRLRAIFKIFINWFWSLTQARTLLCRDASPRSKLSIYAGASRV